MKSLGEFVMQVIVVGASVIALFALFASCQT